MAVLKFLLLAVTVSALLSICNATSCTKATLSTCAKTNYVTGSCESEICACKEGTKPIVTGCLSAKAKITANPGDDSPVFTDKVSASLQVYNNTEIQLVCNPVDSTATVVWKKDGEKLEQQDQKISFPVSIATPTTTFTCQAIYDGYSTDVSDGVTITAIDNVDNMQAPEVTGMPMVAIDKASYTLSCSNLISGYKSIKWFDDGVEIPDATDVTVEYQIDKTNPPKVKCQVTVGTDSTKDSAVVDAPTSYTDTLPSASIREGTDEMTVQQNTDFSLTCDLDGSSTLVVTYTWEKDGTSLDTAQTIFISPSSLDPGSTYKCYATVKNLADTVKSAGKKIIVANKLVGSATVKVTPAQPLVGGYVYISCALQVADPAMVTMVMWEQDSGTAYLRDDNALQMNELTATENTFKCRGTVGLQTFESSTLSFTPVDHAAQKPSIIPSSGQWGVGNTYTLTCDINYITPGLTYQWLKDDQEIAGATEKSYTLKVMKGTTMYSCLTTFDEGKSQKSDALTVKSSNLLRVFIELASADLTDYPPLKPLAGSELTLTCKVIKAASASGTLTYKWSDGSSELSTTSKLDIKANDAETAKTYTCEVAMGVDTLDAKVTVSKSDTLVKPTVLETESSVTTLRRGAAYILYCYTPSYNSDITYVWYKDGTAISGATSGAYRISETKSSDAGNYKCMVEKGNIKSDVSDEVEFSVEAAGKKCNYYQDCDGPQFEPLCKDNRCQCASDYMLYDGGCKKSKNIAPVANFSGLLLLVAALVSTLF